MKRSMLVPLAALAFLACENATDPEAPADESLAVRSGLMPEGYELIELDGLGGEFSHAEAINERGQIVGVREISGELDAFLWEAGATTDLNLPGPGAALDVSNAGLATGWLGNGYGYRAFLWKRDVTLELGALVTSCGSFGRAVNNRGQVVGYSETVCGEGHAGGYSEDHAVLWDRDLMVDLHSADADEVSRLSRAYDINNRGQVVGYLGDGARTRAVLWQDGRTILLGTLPSAFDLRSRAYGINARGQIAGECATAVGTHGCLWDDGRVIDLGWLGAAVAINNRGQVAGHRKYGEYGAVVWSRGTVTELPTPEGWASYVADINEKDQIVGWIESLAPPGSWVPDRAVLWQPTFE